MARRLPVGAGCHAGDVRPVRAVLLDFYCTLVDLSDPVRSRGFDDFARRFGLPLAPGELYRRYTQMITSEGRMPVSVSSYSGFLLNVLSHVVGGAVSRL